MTPIKGFAFRNREAPDAAPEDGAGTPSAHEESSDGQAERTPEAGQLRLVDTSIAESGAPLPHRSLRQTPRRWKVTGGAGESEQGRDRRLADELVKMVQDFNRAMDEAQRSGLICEPNLSTTTSQFGGEGANGHLLSIKIYRKLT